MTVSSTHRCSRRRLEGRGLAAADPRIRGGPTKRDFLPAPFSPPLEPRNVGPIFEIRSTRCNRRDPGHDRAVGREDRGPAKFSPLVGAWHTEFGTLNKWCHIWAYKDAKQRFEVRDAARAAGAWPPGSLPARS